MRTKLWGRNVGFDEEASPFEKRQAYGDQGEGERESGSDQHDQSISRLHEDSNSNRGNLVRLLGLSGERVLHISQDPGANGAAMVEAGLTIDTITVSWDRVDLQLNGSTSNFDCRRLVEKLRDTGGETYSLILVDDFGEPRMDPSKFLVPELLSILVDKLDLNGIILVCFTNPLGVTYLTGTADLTSNRFFDGIEGYPLEPNRSVLTRSIAEAQLRGMGLEVQTLMAFPDHEYTRAIIGPQTHAVMPELLFEIPRFTQVPPVGVRNAVASEYHVWRNLVGLGMADSFANSFVIEATRPSGRTIWDPGTLARYMAMGVEKRFQTITEVIQLNEGIEFQSRHVVGGMKSVRSGAIEHRVETDPLRQGTSLVEVLAMELSEATTGLLRGWVDMLDSALVDDSELVPMDLVPHNLMVVEGGHLEQFDNDWFSREHDRSAVIRRGIFWLAVRLAERAPASALSPSSTIGELAIRLGEVVGLDPEGLWIAEFYHPEARFQVITRLGDESVQDVDIVNAERALMGFTGMMIGRGPLEYRVNEILNDSREENLWLHQKLGAVADSFAEAHALLTEKDLKIEQLEMMFDGLGVSSDDVERWLKSDRFGRIGGLSIRSVIRLNNIIGKMHRRTNR